MRLFDILVEVEVLESNVDMNMEIEHISSNSCDIAENSLFFAIKGFKQDGNDFIQSAISKGAKVVLTDKKQNNIPYVLVENATIAKSKMSANFFKDPSNDVKTIGITGTNGKTTSTYLVKHILEQQGQKVGLIGTNENIVGEKVFPADRTTEDSVEVQKMIGQMRDAGSKYAVMEVSSHSLELNRVSDVSYYAAAYTNISRDHLDFHVTFEEYAKAKSKLFDLSKYGAVNLDDKYAHVMMENKKCEFITFGIDNEKADLIATDLELLPDKVKFTANYKGEKHVAELSIPGRFSAYNALTAIAVCLSLGISLPDIVKALKSAKGVKGRAEVVPTDKSYTILIDYAHTPDGILNILKTVKDFAKGRVISVFGCGGDRDKTKRPLMAKAAAKYSDVCIITSDNPRTENPDDIISDILVGLENENCNYSVISDRKKAILYAMQIACEYDIIVLMGKGHETYQEINGVKYHLDEREIIMEIQGSKK